MSRSCALVVRGRVHDGFGWAICAALCHHRPRLCEDLMVLTFQPQKLHPIGEVIVLHPVPAQLAATRCHVYRRLHNAHKVHGEPLAFHNDGEG